MARTSSTPRWQRVPTIPAPHPGTHAHPAAPPAGTTPIYEELLREWSEANRTLPGGPDLEWARTTRFPPPHDPLTGPPPPPLRGTWFHPA
ncbi:hypothetical protein ACIQ9E_06290 [Streptomyces sp. NPDC094448]|uniref:hypothetical protein n=1 Tax=Streptomyces sp. NPDC094448 TaxID=3366063 RepID=UPI0038231024